MLIKFENEAAEIVSQLKLADGYLDCEKVIIYNIRKQLKNEILGSDVEKYLINLKAYLDIEVINHQTVDDYRNYRYASAFLNTLITIPYWHSWINTINL